MHLQQRISAFVELGRFLGQFSSQEFKKIDDVMYNDIFFDSFKQQIHLAEINNGWFTKENIVYSFNSWSKLLTKSNLTSWIKSYYLDDIDSEKIAVIMAGNIPLVGFHDFLSVLISGHKVLVKQSSNDKHLLSYLAKYIETVEPEFKGLISFTEERLDNFDAVIATGSNNTSRYFEYYFKNKPSIIRKNRNAVAVLSGNETKTQLEALSEDIFRYYGLGCRNVSKLFVPKDYNFDVFFEAIYKWHPIIEKNKYANNYDYNKAVYLMSEFDILENGFFMIKEDESYASPIASLFYEYYEDTKILKTKLDKDIDKIQCVISEGFSSIEVKFGESQTPQLWNYADGIDTIAFLSNL